MSTKQIEMNDKMLTGKDEVNTQAKWSRGKSITRSTWMMSALAVGSALGLMASTSWAAVAPPEPDSPDTSVRWNTKPGGGYTEQAGYGDEDVTGYKGRYIYGASIGILQLPANIPMLPGDVGNPTTFDFPVL